MELSVQKFLDSVTNPNTKAEYKHAIRQFTEWYGKNLNPGNKTTLPLL